ncbi:hypothetical protein A3A63_02930 [Candidatus Gottesmanbacteria bacterium RIFCSPLOWO2_01_FULL_46_9]|uniref:Uncharacterized protein n=1 Tax=Candidatus Gottesmanbacteria bacterium RIFCSPLOWO2_01_FULL_46_9 TaxID=1798394 RepID=A0A1F6B0C3_9BACT|nr:MAG: hypothetical protein A3A63_02930 [Candidatus Gottesmanbacteria bacterium RIFCSPLOWO2_01_FULL_46_9]
MKAVSIVRGRGQLTIPDPIRKLVPWVNPLSAVTISVVKPDEILIKPHKTHIDWERIWSGIEKSRALRGKGKSISAVEFLAQDRKSH